MTPDELCLEVLRHGFVIVDAERGVAYSKRFCGKELGCLNKKGYRVCTLHLNGVRKQVKLHRLIWISVHGIPPTGLMPDHIDRVKTNNSISNLRLVDNAGNAKNRRSYNGEENPAARITRAIAEGIRARHIVLRSHKKVGKEFKVSTSLVAQIVRGVLWK